MVDKEETFSKVIQNMELILWYDNKDVSWEKD